MKLPNIDFGTPAQTQPVLMYYGPSISTPVSLNEYNEFLLGSVTGTPTLPYNMCYTFNIKIIPGVPTLVPVYPYMQFTPSTMELGTNPIVNLQVIQIPRFNSGYRFDGT